MQLNRRERYALSAYLLFVSIAIACTPDVLPPYNAKFAVLVVWIPAARRMLEISSIPARTLSWMLSSFVFLPLIWIFCRSRIIHLQLTFEQTKIVLKGALGLGIFLSPWLLLTLYRSNMDYGFSRLVAAMCFSPTVLAILGPLISTTYALVYMLIGVAACRAAKLRSQTPR